MWSQDKPELDRSVQLQHCEVMTLGDVVEGLHLVPARVEDDPLHGDTQALRPGLCPVADPQVDLELLGRGAETLSRTSGPRAVIWGHGEPGLPAGPSSAPIGVLILANQRPALYLLAQTQWAAVTTWVWVTRLPPQRTEMGPELCLRRLVSFLEMRTFQGAFSAQLETPPKLLWLANFFLKFSVFTNNEFLDLRTRT